MDRITILFLAANPASTGKLMLDEEIRVITEKYMHQSTEII
jgi:hypothetical protein